MMTSTELNTVLNRYFHKTITIHQSDKKRALTVWEEPVRTILQKVTTKDQRFTLTDIPVGSYYERAKVKKPNEFDIMLEMKELFLDSPPYGPEEDNITNDPPNGFTTVMIDQGEERQWASNNCIGHGGTAGLLSAEKVKGLFARYVAEAIRELDYSSFINQTSAGPAVTLEVKDREKIYSIDLTLAIKDFEWPDEAAEWKTRSRNGSPSVNATVQEIWREGCHLVAKRPKQYSGPQKDIEFFWRYSFSAAEKKIFVQGSQGQAGTCRKTVLRILKGLKEDYQMTPLTSYYLKTILLYECEQFPHASEWDNSKLGTRFKSALGRLLACLRQKQCPHYFIKDLNLFAANFNDETYQRLITKIQHIHTDFNLDSVYK